MNAAPPLARATIRAATASDIEAIGALLSLRDRRVWDDDSTRWFVHGLDPHRCRAWIAFANDTPVGLSSMFLRDLQSPAGTLRAGYWANLYIVPEYRDQMLYPRLPMAMFAAAPGLGLDLIYGSVRLPDATLAHTRIGFAKLGGFRVFAKPLRPLRLIGRYKRWRPLAAISPALDWIWATYLAGRHASLPAGFEVEEIDVASPAVEELIAMLAAAGRDSIVDTWTPESFRYRYRRTREGTRYVILGVRRSGERVGALIYRIAERDPDIRVGVIMDVISTPGHETAMVVALAEAERRAQREGCDLMMFLGGLGPAVSAAFQSFGYRSAPELYEVLVWPKAIVTAKPVLGDVSRWRFSFGDHDAF